MTTLNTPGSDQSRSNGASRDIPSRKFGEHPVATGVGAAAGGLAGGMAAAAVTGAAAGTVGGPIGTGAGLVIGAVIGGMAGKAIAERADPTLEDAHWSKAHRDEPYYSTDHSYDDYAPAYRVGYLGFTQYEGRSFEDAEQDLQSDYGKQRGKSRLAWDQAKPATRAAWDRVSATTADAPSTAPANTGN